MDTRAQLVALLNSNVLTGGRRTTAAGIRQFENSIITSVINLIDDKDTANGYLGIDSAGRVDISFITAVTPSGQFLKDDGTWASVLTSVAGLPAVLAVDNTSGGSPINMLDNDEIQWGNSRTNVMKYNLASTRFQLVNTTSTDYLYLHDAGGMDLYSASILKLDAPAIYVTGGMRSTGGLTGLQVHSNTNAILYATDGAFPSALILSGPGNNAELSTTQTAITIEKAYFGTTSTTATMSAISQSASQTTEISIKPDQAYVGSTYVTFAGLEYSGDYSANYTSRSLIDKGYSSSTYLALAGGTMTGALILYTNTPATSLEAASKGYVDTLLEGLDWKESVITASTADEPLLSGVQSVGGVVVGAGRVLLKDQVITTDNGFWDVNSSGAWTRCADASTGVELEYAVVNVLQGTNAGKVFRCVTYPITLGVTPIVFSEWNVATYLAGSGLTLTGSTFSIEAGQVTNTMLAGSIDLTTKVTGVLPVANSEAKIKGAIAATTGLIAYGNGTADTVTTSAGLSYISTVLSSELITATNAGTGGIVLRGYTSNSTHSTIYMRQPTPSGTNYTLYTDGTSTTMLNAPGTLQFASSGTSRITMAAAGNLTVAATGTPVAINSTNSNINKLQFTDNGTSRSYIGASSSYYFTVYENTGAAMRAAVDTNGNLLVGPTSSGGTNIVGEFLRTVTATTQFRVTNASASNGAYVQYTLINNVGAAGVVNLGLVGGGTTTSGVYVQGEAYNMTTSTGWSFGTLHASGAVRVYAGNGVLAFTVNSSSHIVMADGKNLVFNTTTGSKLGDAANNKIGKWGVTPIVQPAHANQAALTDSTTGTAAFALVDSAGGAAAINDNFASLARLVNQLRSDLVATGEIKGAA